MSMASCGMGSYLVTKHFLKGGPHLPTVMTDQSKGISGKVVKAYIGTFNMSLLQGCPHSRRLFQLYIDHFV